MARESIGDLNAFALVARERSFTRAAAKVGVSQSALSHTIRQLEARLGVRLLTRTTRAVSLTEAGERLLDGIGPHLDEIDAQVEALSALRDKPAGTIRVSAADYAITHVLWPKLRKFLPQYPDIKVELILDNGLTDIVNERYDAGVRMGEHLAKDMISARIGPDFSLAVVGSPSYFKEHGIPSHPKDLVGHTCINFRLPSSGGLYVWEFEENGQEIKIRVDGQLAFNNIFNALEAALDGFGMAYIPLEIVQPLVNEGKLEHVLREFSPPWDGYYLYYPSRRQSSPAFAALLDALRHRA
ncbi:LysR family transcriptional regulator [Rhizobium ruizarguesonis]|jgi:DNA-binding transcriptional LysR family regulator|uniref:HTH-type transcriptional regulator TtuA n=1 Tax=Rhizobium ruizarguesonis TaxID=2081791 RepID=A0AAE5BZ32_9HYPH|nr:LysR family transcriptional regulator [Rhizobium ruizarguesonis]QIJ43893.1 LysR family transcriptional regulator [Rhizobium leguminosarum]QJS31029.1 LysR family transcriptional regulator [Rhizobium leguminosarum bv. trifolii TA1]MCB2404636.1 LysR family transcriptional regulator [Rhizobium ruizarguesonis]NEH30165.1 LysR family transcriptional regulator [Rhizobium ruizarguesonis]NEI47308.1 LysR family transcriptional regulator [Rhizobium ruizarguesonis]